VDFVDEQDDIRGLLELIHHRFHALLELSTVLRSSHKRGHIERDNPLAEQHAAHLLFDNAQRQAFSNGRFSDAGFSHQDGVVLLAAAQNLADAFDLFSPTNNRIEAAFLRHAREVTAKVVQDWGLGFGVTLAPR
jgi:hypothetical protein